jgi:Mg/Co/Ni transporter MgtE
VQATALDLLKSCKEKVLPTRASGPAATVMQDIFSVAVYLGIATLIL